MKRTTAKNDGGEFLAHLETNPHGQHTLLVPITLTRGRWCYTAFAAHNLKQSLGQVLSDALASDGALKHVIENSGGCA